MPYIAWAVMMLILPMGLIALYSVTEQGNTHYLLHLYSGALCKIFHGSGFSDRFVALSSDRTENDGDLSAAWLSDRTISYQEAAKKYRIMLVLVDHDPDVDQHAGAYVCVDWTAQ